MSVKVADLMRKQVVSTRPHESVGHVRTILARNQIHTVPVLNAQGGVAGIVSSADILTHGRPATPINQLMTEAVYTIPQYADVQIAARMMRNHRIHHLLVTHEEKLVGILSSFDLLKLVEGHRYVAKNPSTPKERGIGKRTREEAR